MMNADSHTECLQVAMFFVCGIFLAVRGAAGCVAIYIPEKYMKIWVEDKYFYPLDTLPEYIVLVILCWPAFLARMAQSFPNSLLVQKHGKKGAKKAKEDKSHDRSSNQHADNMRSGEHGVHSSPDLTANGS